VTRARILRVCALAAALALMVALVARLGPATILADLNQVGAGAAWLVVVYAAGTAIGALPYHILFPGPKPSLHSTIAGRFAASGVNVIIPLFGMGGEPTRLLWLRGDQRAAGIAAIVVDRLTYAVASALFLVGGALAAIDLANLPRSYVIAGLVGAFALLLIAAIAIYLVSRHRLGGRVHRLISRMRRRTAGNGGDRVDHLIETIFRHRGRVVVAILLGFVARCILGTEIYIAFRVLGVDLSPAAAYTFAAVPVLLAFIGAVVPGQVGIQEGSQALVAKAIGLHPATAVVAVLLTRFRQLVTAAIAWMLIATVKVNGPDRAASELPPSHR
jgi:uncharacterized protein (TIRG00374 family)